MKIYGEMLPGVRLIKHKKHEDHRGDFCELWKISNDEPMRGTFRQLNIATSKKGVLRDMHRQDQTKFVTAVTGTVFDVALEELKQRCQKRFVETGRFIPEKVIEKYYKELQHLKPSFDFSTRKRERFDNMLIEQNEAITKNQSEFFLSCMG